MWYILNDFSFIFGCNFKNGKIFLNWFTKVRAEYGGKSVKVKVEFKCPINTWSGISRIEINTPIDLSYQTSGLCGNTILNRVLNCSMHYELESNKKQCSNSSELLGANWRVKNINWTIDLQVCVWTLFSFFNLIKKSLNFPVSYSSM